MSGGSVGIDMEALGACVGDIMRDYLDERLGPMERYFQPQKQSAGRVSAGLDLDVLASEMAEIISERVQVATKALADRVEALERQARASTDVTATIARGLTDV